MKDIVIIGSNGFAKDVLWVLEKNNEDFKEWNILGFVDEKEMTDEPVSGYGVIGNDDWLLNYPHPISAACGLGRPSLRRRVVQKYKSVGCNVSFPPIISSGAHVSKHVHFGEGCVVCFGAMIAPNVVLDNFVALNLGCTIGHDTVIQEFTMVNPGANVSGNVLIENDCEIGTGACIIQGKRLGPKTVIGAGSVIIRDTPGCCTVVGNPGRILGR